MILKAITIENFKGIREPVRVELRPVTLLFGANSAGKSTVVQALHFAQEIFERHNVDPGKTLIGGEAINLGGFETLVYGHDRSRPIIIRLELNLAETELPVYRLPYVTSFSDYAVDPFREIDSGWVEVQVEWSELLGRPILKEYSVGLNDEPFAKIQASSDLKNIEVTQLSTEHSAFSKEYVQSEDQSSIEDEFAELLSQDDRVGSYNQIFMMGFEVLKPNYIGLDNLYFGVQGQSDAMPAFGRPLAIQEEAFEEQADQPTKREFIEGLSSYIVGVGELARDALRAFRYLGPLREVPPRNFEAETSPDEGRWAHGLAAWDTLARSDQALVDELNKWLEREDRLNTGYQVELKQYKELDINSPYYYSVLGSRADLDEEDGIPSWIERLPVKSRLLLREVRNGIEVQPQDVGVGISQLIPVIVAALTTKTGIVAIEQPELHIHPAWQVVLGDLFLTQAKQRDLVFLLETHSEHLMLRLLRRIRETHDDDLPPGAPEATPGDVSVLYVESTEDGARIFPLKVNESGDFDNKWPRGFFNERAEELF